MTSQIESPKDYIAKQPDERKKELKKIRALIRKSLPKTYKETIKYGMLRYEIPEAQSGKALLSLSLGNQKNYMVMYFSNIYKNEKGEKEFRKKYCKDDNILNMGKSCLRFKKYEDLNLDFLENLFSGKFKIPFH